MSDVWVARDSNGVITCVSHEQDVAACYGVADEFATVTRETLLTPAQAAVLAAAKEWETAQSAICAENGWLSDTIRAMSRASAALSAAVNTLRTQEEL